MLNNNKKLNKLIFAMMVAGTVLTCSGCGTDQVVTLDSLTEIAAAGDETEAESNESESNESESNESDTRVGTIVVHVCGAVLNPGVYQLEEGSRVADALEAAGGFLEDANREYLNLAKVLSDGTQLYFPTMEETEDFIPVSDIDTEEGNKEVTGETESLMVNINTAGKGQLKQIPGIGDVKAEAIVNYRDQNGFFSSLEEIMNVPGIGQGLYDSIACYLCL